MEKFYKLKEVKRSKKLTKNRKEIKGLVLKLKGRLKGISRTRKLILRRGRIGSINYYSSKLGINTK